MPNSSTGIKINKTGAGTPFGITIDHDTLSDNTVTLRNRDTMEQSRISLDQVEKAIKDLKL